MRECRQTTRNRKRASRHRPTTTKRKSQSMVINEEQAVIVGKIKLSNSIDYVGAWYHLAAQYMQGTHIKTAYVSTNSITQGEQVAPLWDKLVNVLNP